MRYRNFLVASLTVPLLWTGCGESGSDASDTSGKYHADGAIREIQKYIEQHEQQPKLVGKIDRADPNWRYKLPDPPSVQFTPGKQYYWDLKTTKGFIRIELLTESAPRHAASTLFLTELGFYDGLPFHRSIQGFMIQGGCPSGNGRGDPGYKLRLELDPKRKHDRPGVVASANSGPHTDGSQFYIMFGSNGLLDGKYTIFGQVTDGLLTVRALERVSGPSGTDGPPLEPVRIEEAHFSVE